MFRVLLKTFSLRLLPPLFLVSASLAATPDEAIRSNIVAAAKPAFESWVRDIPDDRFGDFGLQSREASAKARLLSPIPLHTPSRRSEDLNREKVEAVLSDLPALWLVPVELGGRVVCLVVMDTSDGGAPAPVEFGKSFAAARLDAGLRALGTSGSTRAEDLRFLSFVGPPMDLLLHRQPNGKWRWINLLGIGAPRAEVLDRDGVSAVLDELKKTPVADHL